MTSEVEVTLGPRAPTFVGGVAVLTGGMGPTLTSHLLFLFFGSSPDKRMKSRLQKRRYWCGIKSSKGSTVFGVFFQFCSKIKLPRGADFTMRYHDRVYGIYKESNEQTNKQTKDLLTISLSLSLSLNRYRYR